MNKGKEMIKEIKKLGVESIIMDLKPSSKTVDIDKSKLGGNYFFAVNGIHPKTKEGKEMIFLCQLNLSELTKNHILPNTGLLQFFISEDFKECKKSIWERLFG